jgi:hypothetical protein
MSTRSLERSEAGCGPLDPWERCPFMGVARKSSVRGQTDVNDSNSDISLASWQHVTQPNPPFLKDSLPRYDGSS